LGEATEVPVVLSAEDLTVGYDGKEVLRGVSFTLSDGEVLAVIGPNGSGKTTLLRAALAITPISRGRVRVFGKPPPGGAEAEGLIAYIPQRMEMDRTFPITLGEMLKLSTGRAPLQKYISMLELEGLLRMKVGELSGGQMQRALLAYAIAKEPRLLMMDEPTSWVDAKGADCVLCIMEEFKKKGIAMVVVSHDFSVLKGAATHVLGLGPGGYFFEPAASPDVQGKVASLFGTSHHGECAAFCGPGGNYISPRGADHAGNADT
jgi:ABC-type Mn2+/Zn2+ transport system ATPase subunit